MLLQLLKCIASTSIWWDCYIFSGFFPCKPFVLIRLFACFHSINFLRSQPRCTSGILTGLLGGCIAFSFLEPLFAAVGMPLATVALYTLSLGAACVGMCLGVLLPLILPGACFGATLSVLLGFFVPNFAMDYLNILCPSLTLLGALLSIK